MSNLLTINLLSLAAALSTVLHAGPFAPAAGQPGSEAIAADDLRIGRWGTEVSITRGPTNINFPAGATTSFGENSDALGPANANQVNTLPVVSLGDGGSATYTFDPPVSNVPNSPDIVIFENGFSDTFLELAFVEVSSDGINFFRFPASSLTPTTSQVGGFTTLDPTNIDNLAGKYRAGFGTPFDLEELDGVDILLDTNAITHIRIIDVIGSIDANLGTMDKDGNPINDPFPTDFTSGGFDLDAIGIIDRSLADFAPFEMKGRTFIIRPDHPDFLLPPETVLAAGDLSNLAVIYELSGGANVLLDPSYTVEITNDPFIEIRITPADTETRHFFSFSISGP